MIQGGVGTMQEIDVRELNESHLAPRNVRNVCDQIAFLQIVMQAVVDGERISPEIRDKITVIKMMTESIASTAGFAEQLTRQLLTITGPQDDLSTVVDVRNAILQMASLIERLLGGKNQLRTSLDDDLWPVQCDVSRFEQILLRLVVNAGEAMPRGGTLYVRARNITKAQCKVDSQSAEFAADYVLVEVADEGVGIPKEIAGRLFEPFATTKGFGGGFGLAQVRYTIRSLHGHIICQSEAGRGATFKIFLPRHSYVTTANTAPLE
jgi:two-component system, cell cycle sensor histidine kinase and response regulator CckA